jgi:CPA1 family monovalent cation:H+ antiporter
VEHLFIAVIAVAVVVALSSAGSKLGVAPPLILIALGIAVSFLPFIPVIAIEPEWILIWVLPPLLYASAVSVPVVEFRRDLVAIGGLAIVLVVVTAFAVGSVIHLVLPDVPLAVGVALGAIISPTDAVATTIAKRLGAPSRVITMLDGESLLNDATALVLLRSAVAAAAVGFNVGAMTVDFIRAAAIAAAIGAVVGWLGVKVRKRIHNSGANTTVSFLIPFVAYLPSEELHASGIVAAVVAGLVVNQLAPHHLDALQRTQEQANWKTVEFLLEGAVFLLMGLQVRGIVGKVLQAHGSPVMGLLVGGLALFLALAVRAGFVTGLIAYLDRRTKHKVRRRERLARFWDLVGLPDDPEDWSAEEFVSSARRRKSSFDPADIEQRQRAVAAASAGAPGAVLRASERRFVRRRLRTEAHLARQAELERRRPRPGGGPLGPVSGPPGGPSGGLAEALREARKDAREDRRDSREARRDQVRPGLPVLAGGSEGAAPDGRPAVWEQSRLGGRGPSDGLEQRRRFGPQAIRPFNREEATQLFERARARVSQYVADVDYLLQQPIRPREGAFLVWAGMRGVVTLAAAQTLPLTTPDRSFLVFIAFVVATGSMLLQGSTLPWLARRLDLTGRDTPSEEEAVALDHALGEAALKAIESPDLRRPGGGSYDPRIVALIKLRLFATQLDSSAQPATAADSGGAGGKKPGSARSAAAAGARATGAQPGQPELGEAAVAALKEGLAAVPPSPAAATAAGAAAWEVASRAMAGDDADFDETDEAALGALDRKRQYRELRFVSVQAKREALLRARALGSYSYRTLSNAMAVLDAVEVSLVMRGLAHE